MNLPSLVLSMVVPIPTNTHPNQRKDQQKLVACMCPYVITGAYTRCLLLYIYDDSLYYLLYKLEHASSPTASEALQAAIGLEPDACGTT